MMDEQQARYADLVLECLRVFSSLIRRSVNTASPRGRSALIDTGAGHYCPGGRKLTVFWAAFFRRLSARRWSCSAIAPLWLAARDTAAAPCWRIAQPLFGMPLFPAKVYRSMPSAAAPSCFRRANGLVARTDAGSQTASAGDRRARQRDGYL